MLFLLNAGKWRQPSPAGEGHSVGYYAVADNTFTGIRLAVAGSQICEIPRNTESLH